jgi:hypothetical protein
MTFFCSCRVCKVNSKDGNGRALSTRKTFKKHQKREKASIEKIDETDTTEIESIDGSISSCNVAEKRKFEDESDDRSDINSDNDISLSILEVEDRSKR